MLVALAALLLIFLLATAAGQRLIRQLVPAGAPTVDRLFLAAAGGMGIISSLMVVLGVLGVYRPAGYAGASLALLVLGVPALPDLGRALCETLRSARRHAASSRIASLLTLLLGFHGVCLLVASFAPVYGYDALDRHLTVAKAYLQAGGFVPLTYIWGAEFPSQGVMLYLVSLVLGEDRLSQVMNVYALGVGCLGTFVLARPLGGTVLRLGACLVVLSLPTTSQYMASPYVDVYVQLWILAAWVLLVYYRQTRGWPSLVGAGLFAGSAASVKLQGCIVLALLCVTTAIWLRLPTESWWRSIRRAVGFGLAASLPVSFWLAKSAWFTGNPVYPLFYSTLGGIDWSTESELAQNAYFGAYTMAYTPVNLLRAMWQYLFHTTIYMGNVLGPGFLFAILVARSPSLRRDIGWLAGFGAIQFVAFFHMTTQVRYIYHALPFLATATMGGLWYVLRMQRSYRVAAMAVVGSLYTIHALYAVALVGYVSPALLGQDRDEFLARRVQYYEAFAYINRNLPDSAAVLIPRSFGYYLDRPFIPWLQKDQGLLVHREMRSPEALRHRLDDLGVTHVVADKTKPYNGILEELLETGAVLLYEGQRSSVYALDTQAPHTGGGVGVATD